MVAAGVRVFAAVLFTALALGEPAAAQDTPQPAEGAGAATEPLPGAARVPSPQEGIDGTGTVAPGAAMVPSPTSPLALPQPAGEASDPAETAAGEGAAGGEEAEAPQEEPAAVDEAGEDAGEVADDVAAPEAPAEEEGEAAMVVGGVLLPRADAFADRALALQNAVLRYCHSRTAVSRRSLEAAFADTVRRVSGLVPAAFGSAAAETATARLLTPVADTAFSRSRLLALVTGRSAPPRTVAALAEEDVALQGLPALEALLLEPSAAAAPLERRCALATVVAANVRAVALRVAGTWRAGRVEEHWRGNEPELAGRLRLRDLVQGLIVGTARLNRDVAQFLPDPLGNPELPFHGHETNVLYLDALAASLSGQASLVRQMGASSEEAFVLLSSIMSALEEGRINLLAHGDGRPATAVAMPFQRVQEAVMTRLPIALGFDLGAFQIPPAAASVEVN